MTILVLGSNSGDRLTNLRKALSFIKKIPQLTVEQVSPVYISDALLPIDAPISWDTPYLNAAVRCKTQLSPDTLLQQTKTIEFSIMGRKPEKRWGPRIIDIDIVAWEDLILIEDKLHLPHKNLHERPFALWPLADVSPRWIYPLPGPYQGKTAAEICVPWGSRFEGKAPFHTRQIPQRIDTSQLVGILNLTPDSFSADGQADEKHAIQHAHALVTAGAEIIDIGAEATGPSAVAISADTEWQRLAPVLEKILAARSNMLITPKISIDTRHEAIATRALALGVNWVNDVSGLEDDAMRQLVKNQSCDIVIMHHLGIPVNKNVTLAPQQDPVKNILLWAEQRITQLEQEGISRERIIFDVGNGYGKTPEQSFELMKNISEFHRLGTRLLVGHSRKVFLTLLTNKPAAERDIETVTLALFLAKQGVDYLRVHNVDACARSLKTAAAIHL